MSDMDNHLRMLKAKLAQDEEILSVLSLDSNHDEKRTEVEKLKAEIKEFEDWEQGKKVIREQGCNLECAGE